MSYRSKRRTTDILVYTALTLVILSVVTLTVFTFVSAGKKSKPLPPAPSDSGTVNEESGDAQSDVSTSPVDEKTGGDGEDGGWLLPVTGYLLKGFSVELPVFSETMQDYRTHSGIDISAAVGDPVVAVGAGFIREIIDDPMMGRTVCVSHEGDLVSVYSNLLPTDIEGLSVGSPVSKGQIIGAVGDSALAESVESEHLHFELLEKGAPVDPTARLDFSSVKKEDRGGE